MENELLSIGKVAALSGLPVGTLRYYDGAGVLTPVMVDPSSGYRFYSADQVRAARLIAHLRRVGMPVADIQAVLVAPKCAEPILDAHLARLEAGLADARREISIVKHILENPEIPMRRCTLPADELTNALRAVRYAVSTDLNDPRLNGVYFDGDATQLRLVATDRHRLATSSVTTNASIDLHLLVPAQAIDEILAHEITEPIEVALTAETITFTSGDVTVTSAVPDVDFPSYRVLLEHGGRQIAVDASQLRADLAAAPTTRDPDTGQEVSLLTVDLDNVQVCSVDGAGADVVAVNRDYLLDALALGDQLTLAIDDPIAPLAIRDPRRAGTMSVLMPVRLNRTV